MELQKGDGVGVGLFGEVASMIGDVEDLVGHTDKLSEGEADGLCWGDPGIANDHVSERSVCRRSPCPCRHWRTRQGNGGNAHSDRRCGYTQKNRRDRRGLGTS